MIGYDSDVASDWVFLRKAKWKETFAFLPHRCRISKRLIWLKKAYKGVAIYYGPDTPAIETQWHESGEHIKWLLTKPDNLIEFMSDIPVISVVRKIIIDVQPMTGPAGSIFKMKTRYKKK